MTTSTTTARLPGGFKAEPDAVLSAMRLEGDTPQGLLRASSTDQIQTLVQWASASGQAIVPISSGPGVRRRGDSRTRSNEWVLDLSQNKKILKIGAEDCVALIEPGVSFDELDRAIKPQGLRSFRPLLPRAGKSVIAAYMEREPVLCPTDHWDTPDPLGSMEIVFGNGKSFRTGGAASPGSIEDNWAKGNRFMSDLGPGPVSYGRVLQGAQGCFGVVSWSAVQLERTPALEYPFFVESQDLAALTRFARQWCYRRLIGPMFIVSGAQLAAMTGLTCTAPWVAFAALAAPDFFAHERLAYELEYVRSDAAAQGLSLSQQCGSVGAQQFYDKLLGTCSEFWKHTAFGQFDEIGMVCQLDQCAQLAAIAQQDEQLAGLYIQPQVQGVMCHLEISLRASASHSQAQRNARLVHLARALQDGGGFISRPHAPWGQVAFERDPAIADLLRTARTILDPQHVLSPQRLCFA